MHIYVTFYILPFFSLKEDAGIYIYSYSNYIYIYIRAGHQVTWLFQPLDLQPGNRACTWMDLYRPPSPLEIRWIEHPQKHP